MIYGARLAADGASLAHNIDRPHYLKGELVFSSDLLTKYVFTAASGLPGEFYSVPYGVYILTAQPAGYIIRRLYLVHGLKGAYLDTVWNVGIPGDITNTGYDPALRRDRHGIQIHCDPAMYSEGCVVMSPMDFSMFSDAMKALAMAGHKLGLIVQKEAPAFTIFGRTVDGN